MSLSNIREHLAPAQISSAVNATERVNLWTGSIRSGKTIASLLTWLDYVASAPYGGELVMVGRTRDSLARNVFGPLQDTTLFGQLAKQISYTAGAPSGKILGRTIHCLGASDARSEMVLRGLTVAGAYVDEVTLITEAFWNTLIGRMSVMGAKLFGTTNPDGPSHWLKRQVIDRAAELGYRVFHFVLADNEHLARTNPAYVAQIMREYTGLWYRRFILGEWVQAEGAVFDMWDVDLHVIKAADLPEMAAVIALGIDYGTTNPTRGLMLGLGAGDKPKLYGIDEWAPERATDAGLSDSLRRWLQTRPNEAWRAPQWIAVDPAAASFKLQLFNDGIGNVVNARNDVLAGIRTVASLLATGNLIVSDACQHLIEQLPGYAWDPKATARGLDEPIKKDDHEVDALRYAVHTTRTLWRDHIPMTTAADDAPGAESPDAA